ncbi:MAG: amidohydrolase family protein [Chloroflexota bacterium]
MKNVRNFIFALLIPVLIGCSPGKETTAQPSVDQPVSVVTAAPAGVDLASKSDVTVSAQTPDEPPGNVIDGNPATIWNAGASAPQWIQLDLGSAATVTGIRLTVAQYPDGETLHQVFAGASVVQLRLVQEFSGPTSDGQVLEFIPREPLTGIRVIKIVTIQSPSWVAWKEIEVSGFEGGETPTPETVIEAADVIYYNGTILTMEEDRPTAEAIAIKGDKILAVGKEADVMGFKGGGTMLIDLQGLTLTPGFIDSHAHRIGDRWHFGNVSAEEMIAKALSQGWTSIHELFVFDQRLNELVNMDRADALPIRVSMYLTMNFEYTYDQWWQAYQPLYQYSPYLQIAGLKITLDREWGEQVFFTQEQYTRMVLDATQGGWQVATHSFSPKANQIVLNGYEAGLNGGDNDTLRLRLEHIGTMTDEQLRLMADLGIIGSVGLINAGGLPDDASFKKYIPESEVEHTARWRDLIDAGVYLIGNTDDPWCCTDWRNNFQAPPNDASVAEAIYQGVTLYTFKGKQPEPWQAAQAVTVQEALEMLTINGAYAAHQEDVIGSLRPGKYADLVILSANPLTTPVGQIPNIQVMMTMVGGDVKYCAQNQQSLCNIGQ